MGSTTLDHRRIAGQRLTAISLTPSVLVTDRLDQFFFDVVAHGNGLGHVLGGGAGVLRTVQQRAKVAGNS